MADKEVILNHSEISDPQTITEVTNRRIREAGLDPEKHTVTHIEDDEDGDSPKGRRKLKIRNVKYFGPWRHRG